MVNRNKVQEGVFIGLFALGVLVAISLAVSFMGNRVTDLLNVQGKVMAGKQSYWLAYSGIEIAATNRFAGVAAGTKTYTLSNGSISVLGESSADKFNGADRTNVITSTGSIADGARKIKYTLGSSTEYALFLDGDDDIVDIGAIDTKVEMQLSCNESEAGHSSEAACDAGKDNHSDLATGHFNKIIYTDGGAQADFSISFWVKPDYDNMDDDYGVIIAANNCSEGDDCNNERGIVIGLLKASGFLRIWHTPDETDFATALSADSWHHVVYTRSAATPGSGVGTMYLNGILLGTDSPDNSWFKSAAAGELWNLGTDIDTGPVESENYAGCMDEVAIWRAVLSLTQIQTLYIQGKSFDIATNMSTNLAAYWDFDNTSNDGSGNGFTSTITGSAYTGY
jgi:hypothetical protein